MANIEVDREKLEYGLEKGISHSGTIYDALDPKIVLRYAACGLVSAAIYQYLQEQGIESTQYISTPRLSFDPKMRHVVPAIEVDDNPMVLDGSYSQFLRYAGLDKSYELITGESGYPEEKVAIFRFSAQELFVSWMADAALRFQAQAAPLKDLPKVDEGSGLLVSAAEDELRDTYTRIYDTSKFSVHRPSLRVINDGIHVARFIPDDVISIH